LGIARRNCRFCDGRECSSSALNCGALRMGSTCRLGSRRLSTHRERAESTWGVIPRCAAKGSLTGLRVGWRQPAQKRSSPRALGFPRCRHWNDRSRHGRAHVEIALPPQSGNFSSRSIAW
jgi:hypothetical protein